MNLEETIRNSLVRFIVQKTIFCPVTGDVLDYRTCVVLLDSDDDPCVVFSQAGYQKILSIAAANPEKQVWQDGYHVDLTTVK